MNTAGCRIRSRLSHGQVQVLEVLARLDRSAHKRIGGRAVAAFADCGAFAGMFAE